MNEAKIKACPYKEAVEMIRKICRSKKHKDPISDIECECNRADRITAERAGDRQPAPASTAEAKPDCTPRTFSATRPLTLTMEEIRHLGLLCGMVIERPTCEEKEDERETEIVIAPWPVKGVKGDDGMLPPHKLIAYYAEYPEEGCVPLGSPNAKLTDTAVNRV